MMKIKIVNNTIFPLPAYQTSGSAGMDVRANIESPITLAPLERALVPTGIHVQIPQGFEIQVRPRSGLAIKEGIGVLNSPGTIDSDFRGEIKIIIVNVSNSVVTINPGERVAQLVVIKHEVAEWEQVEQLDETQRGDGGFGHTGK